MPFMALVIIIPKSFSFQSSMNGTGFKVRLLSWLWLVWKNVADVHVLIEYLTTLMKVFISSKGCLIEPLGSLIYSLVIYKQVYLDSFLLYLYHFISFLFLSYLLSLRLQAPSQIIWKRMNTVILFLIIIEMAWIFSL